jgi:hypothetical protein
MKQWQAAMAACGLAALGAAGTGCPAHDPLARAATGLARQFDALDTNADGRLGFAEATGGGVRLTAALFNTMDADADGLLRPAEIHVHEPAPDRSLRGMWVADAALQEAIGSGMAVDFTGRRFRFEFQPLPDGERFPTYALSGRFTVDVYFEPRHIDLAFDALEFDVDAFRAEFRPDAEAIYAGLSEEELAAVLADNGVADFDALVEITLDGFQANIEAELEDRLAAMAAAPLRGVYSDAATRLALLVPGLFGFSDRQPTRPARLGDGTLIFERPGA